MRIRKKKNFTGLGSQNCFHKKMTHRSLMRSFKDAKEQHRLNNHMYFNLMFGDKVTVLIKKAYYKRHCALKLPEWLDIRDNWNERVRLMNFSHKNAIRLVVT